MPHLARQLNDCTEACRRTNARSRAERIVDLRLQLRQQRDELKTHSVHRAFTATEQCGQHVIDTTTPHERLRDRDQTVARRACGSIAAAHAKRGTGDALAKRVEECLHAQRAQLSVKAHLMEYERWRVCLRSGNIKCGMR